MLQPSIFMLPTRPELLKLKHPFLSLNPLPYSLLLRRDYLYSLRDQAKWVWTKNKSKLSFLTHCLVPTFQNYILVKILSKLNLQFQRYSYLSAAQNSKLQKEIQHFYLLYLKINSSEFQLILLDHISYTFSTLVISFLYIFILCIIKCFDILSRSVWQKSCTLKKSHIPEFQLISNSLIWCKWVAISTMTSSVRQSTLDKFRHVNPVQFCDKAMRDSADSFPWRAWNVFREMHWDAMSDSPTSVISSHQDSSRDVNCVWNGRFNKNNDV